MQPFSATSLLWLQTCWENCGQPRPKSSFPTRATELTVPISAYFAVALRTHQRLTPRPHVMHTHQHWTPRLITADPSRATHAGALPPCPHANRDVCGFWRPARYMGGSHRRVHQRRVPVWQTTRAETPRPIADQRAAGGELREHRRIKRRGPCPCWQRRCVSI